MRVIAEERNAWMLYRDGDRFYLSVICGGVGVYTRDVELGSDEPRAGRALADFARQVNRRPDEFQERHIADFYRWPAVERAAGEWRAAQDSD